MTLRAAFEARIGDFDLAVDIAADDELVVLYGPSGSGKTVTLRAIAGLLPVTSGRIEIGGRVVVDGDAGVQLAPQQRRVGYVVQEPALFPHLDVRRNVLVGVERSTEALARYEQLRAMLHIEGLDERRPHQLSGGQQQRVALARALVRPTEALLLDEPFSALDEALREELRAELLRLRRELRLPILFVTHDLREAHLLADRIAVLDEGRVLQFDRRDEVFRHPRSRRVAELTGVRNIVAGRIEGGRVVVQGLALTLPEEAPPAPEGSALDVGIRAERCILRRLDPEAPLPPNCFVALVVEDLAFGNAHLLRLAPEGPGPTVLVEVASRPYEVLGVASQQRWVVELPPGDLQLMPAG
ncbi:MAG: ABC transporter ATP-binding protein [Chloroflexi bacterium]|nr:ABC transporter ATP-binding protein [Chloroflexota bacterium]